MCYASLSKVASTTLLTTAQYDRGVLVRVVEASDDILWKSDSTSI